MSNLPKALLLQLWFFIGVPAVGAALVFALRLPGMYLFVALFALWGWELYAFMHYRHCRQEEFLQVLETAAVSQAPMENVLRAYLRDRPTEHLYRGALLFFVFPGFYWIHLQRSFDHRLTRLAEMLDKGFPLDEALHYVPGLVSRDIALAVNVGQFNGKMNDSLKRIPDRRAAAQWLEVIPRILYPLLVLTILLVIITFLTIFIVPKFEKLMLDFKMRMPIGTEILIAASRGGTKFAWVVPVVWLGMLAAGNWLIYSSRARWYCPLLNRVYRPSVRGQFLHTLGLMLETGKPLPRILARLLDSGWLPGALHTRVANLTVDLQQGEPLAQSVARHGLVTALMSPLIESAEKAHNLPWALQELGDSLKRRSARLLHRFTMVAFPLILVVIACLVGFVAVSMFAPLVAMIEGMEQLR